MIGGRGAVTWVGGEADIYASHSFTVHSFVHCSFIRGGVMCWWRGGYSSKSFMHLFTVYSFEDVLVTWGIFKQAIRCSSSLFIHSRSW